VVEAMNCFFLSEWLWSITWGLYHIPINSAILFLLLKLCFRGSTIFMGLLAVAAQIVSFLLLTLFVVLVSIYLCGTVYCVPVDIYQNECLTGVQAALFLAGIYACLQILFFITTVAWHKLPLLSMGLLVVLSNLCTVLFVLPLISAL
jgi:hypothetical protein